MIITILKQWNNPVAVFPIIIRWAQCWLRTSPPWIDAPHCHPYAAPFNLDSLFGEFVILNFEIPKLKSIHRDWDCRRGAVVMCPFPHLPVSVLCLPSCTVIKHHLTTRQRLFLFFRCADNVSILSIRKRVVVGLPPAVPLPVFPLTIIPQLSWPIHVDIHIPEIEMSANNRKLRYQVPLVIKLLSTCRAAGAFRPRVSR